MSAKLKVKLGHIEIEFEGTEEFIKGELPSLIKNFSELVNKVSIPPPAAPKVNGGNGGAANGNAGAIPGFQSTTGNLAVKLGVKSEPELVLTAAARLAFVSGQETFSRKDLLKEMQTATAFYTAGHSKNMTLSLRRLIKDDKLNERSADSYALSATAHAELSNKIRG